MHSNLSKQNNYLLVAHEKGYRVIDGRVISPFTGMERKYNNVTKPYPKFCIRMRDMHGKWTSRGVDVHKLVAYQKYGNVLFNDALEVRHLDSNPSNNLDENVVLGSHRENMQDMPKADRERRSIIAATKLRKFTDIEMDEIRVFHKGSYKETMKEFNVGKSTLHYILNTKYKTSI